MGYDISLINVEDWYFLISSVLVERDHVGVNVMAAIVFKIAR